MVKRAYVDIRQKKSRSRKTAKRLKVKHEMLAKKGMRIGSVAYSRAR